jgi:hypothetical protein
MEPQLGKESKTPNPDCLPSKAWIHPFILMTNQLCEEHPVVNHPVVNPPVGNHLVVNHPVVIHPVVIHPVVKQTRLESIREDFEGRIAIWDRTELWNVATRWLLATIVFDKGARKLFPRSREKKSGAGKKWSNKKWQ